jgi:hypothetical protein
MAAMPDYTRVNCALCGGKLGTLGNLRIASEALSEKTRR